MVDEKRESDALYARRRNAWDIFIFVKTTAGHRRNTEIGAHIIEASPHSSRNSVSRHCIDGILPDFEHQTVLAFAGGRVYKCRRSNRFEPIFIRQFEHAVRTSTLHRDASALAGIVIGMAAPHIADNPFAERFSPLAADIERICPIAAAVAHRFLSGRCRTD